MVTVSVGNSYSKVLSLNVAQISELRNLLSYLPGGESAAHFSRYPPKRVSLVTKGGDFPTGLLPNVIAYLFASKIRFELKDARIRPPEGLGLFHLNLEHIPYREQLKAAEAALQYKRGGIVMPTGTGKSLVIALIIAKLQVPTLVVVPSLEIKKQLEAFLQQCFGSLEHISVQNIDSVDKSNIFDAKCLILDECHHAAAKTYQDLNKKAWDGIYYRFFLSATFFRNQSNEHLLFQAIAGEIIYELEYRKAVELGYIVPVDAMYLEMPKTAVKGHTWATVYGELVVNNHKRNLEVAQLAKKLLESGKNVLILVKEIEHGRKLAKLSGLPFVNGQDEDSRLLIKGFNSGVFKAVIATTGIMGEGVDTCACECVIIAGLGKAKSAFMQQVGRAVRKFPGKESAKIFIIKDSSHKWTLNHFNAQKRILIETYGVKPVKLEKIS